MKTIVLFRHDYEVTYELTNLRDSRSWTPIMSAVVSHVDLRTYVTPCSVALLNES